MLRAVRSARPTETKTPSTPTAMALAEHYCSVRFATEALTDPLDHEDLTVQSLPEASPVKWHLGHTSWFFEKFVLKEARRDYPDYHRNYDFLFNSYYEAFGARQCREKRGQQSRPSTDEIMEYRRHVDAHVLAILCTEDELPASIARRLTLGLQHEQQHQELILTDIKHALATSPLRKRYLNGPYELTLLSRSRRPTPLRWHSYPTSLTYIGAGTETFSFDHETPRHQVLVHDFELAGRLVTCGEYMAFIADGGYERPEFWLMEGWNYAKAHAWEAPLYWERIDGRFWHTTLAGLQLVTEAEPVCHVSYFEADAYARWAQARLPTEQEWEVAASPVAVLGNFVESRALHPLALPENEDRPYRDTPRQMFGDVWEWTASPYTPYPGFQPWPGALGEYNGKFMCNQMVLRGGSCATPRDHVRATYRNYFPPTTRWQFSGIRLARS